MRFSKSENDENKPEKILLARPVLKSSKTAPPIDKEMIDTNRMSVASSLLKAAS